MTDDYVDRLRAAVDDDEDVLAVMWELYPKLREDLRAGVAELERLREFESAISEAQVSLQAGVFERGWWKGFNAKRATGAYAQVLLDVAEYANEICALNADAAPQQPEHAGESR